MPAPPPSTFNLPTFVVAAVGAFSGLVSAAWLVVSHILTGAKISLRIEYIFVATESAVGTCF